MITIKMGCTSSTPASSNLTRSPKRLLFCQATTHHFVVLFTTVRPVGILFVIVSFLASCNVFAHGEVHGQIGALTSKIDQEPSNAELLVQRGELYRIDGDVKSALADADAAAKIQPDLPGIHLLRGRVYFDKGVFHLAKASLSRFLTAQPDHVDALVTRARCRMKTKDLAGAVADFSRAIEKSSAPQPDFFLERAEAVKALGDKEKALAGLDEGIQRLGGSVPLVLAAIELEKDLKRFDAALVRVRKLSDQSQRKDTWLAMSGEILEQAGRKSEARDTFAKALSAIELLPPHLRGTESVQALQLKVKEGMARLSSSNVGAVR